VARVIEVLAFPSVQLLDVTGPPEFLGASSRCPWCDRQGE